MREKQGQTPFFSRGLGDPDSRRRPVPDVARDTVGGFLDERAPLDFHAVGGSRERQGGDEVAAVVPDPRGDAAHADLRFLVVGRPALAVDALEIALERRHPGERVLGLRREAGALGVVAQPREPFLEQEQLSRRRDVQRRARADHVHHAHRRAARRGALDVDDLIVVLNREVHGLASLRVQLAHHRQRELAHADARFHQVAELEQAHPQAIAARLDPVDQPVGRERRQDAVRRRRMQLGVLRDLLQAERLRMLRKHLEQARHALDHLDRILLLVSRRHAKDFIPRCEMRRIFAMPVVTSIEDLRELSKRRIAKAIFDYVDRGSYSEATLRANRTDLESLTLRQRVAIDVDRRSTRSAMLGQEVSMPVALAPVGLTGLNWADGEMLAARAAERFGVPYTLSTMSICSIEDVAGAPTRPLWFQLFWVPGPALSRSLTPRAQLAGRL